MRIQNGLVRISELISLWVAAVQEPCLLAMLRIAADCEEIPTGIIMAVSEISRNAGRHIRHVG